MGYLTKGICLWGIILIIVLAICINAYKTNSAECNFSDKRQQLVVLVTLALLCMVCTIPMGWSPIYNGQEADYRNEYEVLANSFLHGHLYLEYEVDPRLLELENPYDLQERIQSGAEYYWDTAFYDGKYYMYFGVVPVVLLFIPFRFITGQDLITYHATQICTIMFLIGLFMFFQLLVKKMNSKLSVRSYLWCACAVGIMSVWYAVSAPALYCTAIMSGLCCQIWSLFLLTKVVWENTAGKKQQIYAFFGGLLGALSFGCRPPIAIANLIAIPLAYSFLKKEKYSKKSVLTVITAIIPFVLVGVLLMAYNFARFQDPFEFGQAYQLTVTDQSNYGDFWSRIDVTALLYKLKDAFIKFDNRKYFIPKGFNGIWINYPILLLPFVGIMLPNVWRTLKEKRIVGWYVSTLFSVIMILIMDIQFAPYLMERYNMDVYWLLGIMTFVIVLSLNDNMKDKWKNAFNILVILFSIITIIMSIYFFLLPNDGNVAEYYYEEFGRNCLKTITLGLWK